MKLGDDVGWILCDEDIGAGCHGVITCISEDWVTVQFPTDSFEMNPKALYRCVEIRFGFALGDQVLFNASDKDIRPDDVGIVIGPRAKAEDNQEEVCGFSTQASFVKGDAKGYD